MKTSVQGVLNQVLQIEMEAGERVWVQKRSLVSLSPGIRWAPKVPGGVGGMVMRALSGESLFLVQATASEPGTLHVASPEPSMLYAWDLAGGPVTTLRGNFLAAVGEVSIEVGIARRPLAALFGGAGLLLQTVYGQGTVYISVKGDLTENRLEAGHGIRVSTGNLAAFSREIDFDVRMVGGCRKILFGGEGAIISRLGGPGLALTQSLKRKGKTGNRILKIIQSVS
ncbi:MAG: AIM24 family protein [Planctomycetota bacterium]|jgi:uncharacterized protein (AIM24 family)